MRLRWGLTFKRELGGVGDDWRLSFHFFFFLFPLLLLLFLGETWEMR